MLIGREDLHINDCIPSNKLETLVKANTHLANPYANAEKQPPLLEDSFIEKPLQGQFINQPHQSVDNLPMSHAQSTESDESSISPSFYRVGYITTHKEACTCTAFNHNSSLFATGSQDKSIKIIDMHRVMSRADFSGDMHSYDLHPVVRTICDSSSAVSVLKFHTNPNSNIIFSGCQDGTVHCFSFTRNSHKRTCAQLNEVGPIKCLEIHPAGFHMLLTINQPTSNFVLNKNTKKIVFAFE